MEKVNSMWPPTSADSHHAQLLWLSWSHIPVSPDSFSGIPAQQHSLAACPLSLLPSLQTPTQSGCWDEKKAWRMGFFPPSLTSAMEFPGIAFWKERVLCVCSFATLLHFFHLCDVLVFCSWEISLLIVVENLTFLNTSHQQRGFAPVPLNAWQCLLMMQPTSSCKQTHASWCYNSQDNSLLWLQLQSHSSGCSAIYTSRTDTLKKMHLTR